MILYCLFFGRIVTFFKVDIQGYYAGLKLKNNLKLEIKCNCDKIQWKFFWCFFLITEAKKLKCIKLKTYKKNCFKSLQKKLKVQWKQNGKKHKYYFYYSSITKKLNFHCMKLNKMYENFYILKEN